MAVAIGTIIGGSSAVSAAGDCLIAVGTKPTRFACGAMAVAIGTIIGGSSAVSAAGDCLIAVGTKPTRFRA